ncbi:hypothetical protein [Rhizocola hellebori]|nr:hypothetical protein [Rhizocola hellebori]
MSTPPVPFWLNGIPEPKHVQGQIWDINVRGHGPVWVGPWNELKAFNKAKGLGLVAAHIVGREHLLDVGSRIHGDRAPCVAVEGPRHDLWTKQVGDIQFRVFAGRKTKTHLRASITRSEVAWLYATVYSEHPELIRISRNILGLKAPPTPKRPPAKAIPPPKSAAPTERAGKTGGKKLRSLPLDPDKLGRGDASRKAEVKSAGVAVAIAGANFILNVIIDYTSAQRMNEEVKRREPIINRQRAEQPELGMLLVFVFHGARQDPESGLSVSGRFVRLETSRGHTEHEARQRWAETPRLEPRVDETHEFRWYEPLKEPSLQQLSTPFPKIGAARFADERKVRFQTLEFSAASGFDAEKVLGPEDLSQFGPYPMIAMQVPEAIDYVLFGRIREKKLAVSTRKDQRESPVAVLILDDGTAVVPVWPASKNTAKLFAALPGIDDKIGALRHMINNEMIRWVRPEWIVVTPAA